MSILQGVLLEEKQRFEKNIFHYKEMLSKLPKGTIFIRQMGNAFFVYRRRKENGKVISEYLGRKEDELAIRQIELSNEYKRIRNNLSLANKELIKLVEAYKAYDRK